MKPLIYTACLCFGIYLFHCRKGIKCCLLAAGIITMPFRTDYTFLDMGNHIGWTGSLRVSISDVIFLVLFLLLIIQRQSALSFPRRVLLPTLGFVAACALSMGNSTWLRMSLLQLVMICQVAFISYFVVYNSINSEQDIQVTVQSIVVSLLLQAIIAISQFTLGMELDLFSTGSGMENLSSISQTIDMNRAFGTIGKPNGFAAYMVPLLLLAISLFLLRGTISRKLLFFAVALGPVALVLSFSRGGWLSFVVSLVVLLGVLRKRRVIGMRVLLVLALLFAVGLIVSMPVLEARIFGDDGNAAGSRIPLMQIAWNMIKAHPLIGIGTNTFRNVMHSYVGKMDSDEIYFHMVHDQYLLVFSEAGIIGLAAFIWLMLRLFREGYDCTYCPSNDLVQAVGFGLTMGFMAIGIHMLVDIYVSHLHLGLIFLLGALASAAKRVEGERIQELIHSHTQFGFIQGTHSSIFMTPQAFPTDQDFLCDNQSR